MPELFEPTVINGMMLENRFVRSATYDGMANDDGSCTPKLINSMAQLAEGGVGLIITGGAYVSHEGMSGPGQMGADRRDLLPGLLEMTDAVHKNGGKIAFQIFHGGCHASSRLIGTTPIGPSSRQAEEGSPCRKMTSDDLNAVIESFGNAAALAKEAGFDAVQIHAAHGVLLSEFLSPVYNRRKDSYGGSIENRARIILEVLRRIRESAGRHYPILIKVNSDDYLDGGFSTKDMLAVATMLEYAGIDAIELSGGTSLPSGRFTPIRQGRIKPEDEGYYLDAAIRFKKKISVPLMLVGGIRSYDVSERLIEEGITDYISLCRPLICEPDLINRWKSGDIRPAACLSDNLCLKSLREGKGAHCELEEKSTVHNY